VARPIDQRLRWATPTSERQEYRSRDRLHCAAWRHQRAHLTPPGPCDLRSGWHPRSVRFVRLFWNTLPKRLGRGPLRASPTYFKFVESRRLGVLAILIRCDNIQNVAFVVREYITADGANPFRRWLARLATDARARIQVRILRFEAGNLGDHKAVGDGVWEARSQATACTSRRQDAQ
jgi:hypothetical protein